MRIIGFAGKKGVGKSYVAKVVANVLYTEIVQDCAPSDVVIEMSFADPIKEFCVNVLLCDRECIYGPDDKKNQPTKYSWEQMPEYVRLANPGKSGPMTHRHVMQVFGTEFTRDVWNKNIWTDALYHRIKSGRHQNVLITDVRFQNEVEAINGWGGQVWQVVGPQRGEFGDTHASEISIESIKHFDATIRNGHGDNISTLAAQVRQVLGKR